MLGRVLPQPAHPLVLPSNAPELWMTTLVPQRQTEWPQNKAAFSPEAGHASIAWAPKASGLFYPWILHFILVWTHSVFPSWTRSFQGSCSTRLANPAALLSLHHGTSPPPAPGWPKTLHRNTEGIYYSHRPYLALLYFSGHKKSKKENYVKNLLIIEN